MVAGRLLRGTINLGNEVEVVGHNCNIKTVITGERENTLRSKSIVMKL